MITLFLPDSCLNHPSVHTADLFKGCLCEETSLSDVTSIILPKYLIINTLDTIEDIARLILKVKKDYQKAYQFEDKTYALEHTFFNIFNHGPLLRTIHLPIK